MRGALLTALLMLAAAGDGPAGGRGATPPDAYEAIAVPEPSELALQHYRSGVWLWLIAQAWGLAIPALLLWTGQSARLRDLSWRLGRRWLPSVAIYAALYVALSAALDLPITYYAGFVRPHAYGLSNQAFAKWLGDNLKGLAVGMALAALLLWIPFALIARSPRRWWIFTWLATIPLLLGLILVKPIWFDPLFNRFGPMKDMALEARILAMADRAGIEGGRVFEVDKSRDTKTVNAYVTGLFGTRRIVLWDTLLARLSAEEVLCVMGHEMGHFVLGHVMTGLLLSCAGSFVGLFFVHSAATRLVRRKRFQSRTGVDRLSDFASFPLLLLLGQIFFLVTSPLSFAISRYQEHEADRFALEITRDNRSCALAFVKLQDTNLSNPRPGPFYVFWRATHPPIGDRIDFSNGYRPWVVGARGRYEHLFRPARDRGGP